MPGVLDATARADALRKLTAGPLDVLVIGGGVTGAGAALDAASRGLRVGLVEARDLAAGTSSRSSKLVHGGLRYLEQRDFKLVREALRERDLLVSKLAPHLVRPVPFLYPIYRKVLERPYVGAGLVLHGAIVVTRASAVALLRSGSRVVGATVRDEETGRSLDVRAARVVVCAGVWS